MRSVIESGDTLTLFCVNRKTGAAIRSKLEISNFALGTATASELRAASVFAENNEQRPNAIHPRPVEFELSGNAFDYEFPPASVTVMTLKRR